MLDAAQTCPQKYKYRYIDKLEEPGDPSQALNFGTALHAGLQATLEDFDGLAVFEVFWNSLKDTRLVSDGFTWEQSKHLGEVFLSRFERLHAKHFKPFMIEEQVKAEIGGIEFEGTPDFVGEYKGVPSVVDWKTSSYPYDKVKLFTNMQMPLYAAMVKKAKGYDVKQLVYVVFIKREERIQVLTVPLTDELLQRAIRNAVILSEELQTRTVFPMNTNSCQMGKFRCAYLSKCYPDLKDK